MSTSTSVPRSNHRLLGVVALLVSIGVFILASAQLGSTDPGTAAVALWGLVSLAAVAGAASGLAIATAWRPASAVVGRVGAVVLALGVVIGVAYWVLSAFGVAGLGEPTDIGGGLVQLLASGATAVGAFLMVGARRRW